MKNKMMLLAVSAVAAVAFAALPAVASAGEPSVECGGAVCGAFTTHGAEATLATTSGTQVVCASNVGTGKYTTKTTGEISLTFSGCKDELFGASCTTPGQASGVIKTGLSVFHNIMIESTAQEAGGKAGVLITNPAGGVPYTTFNCAAFIHVEVSGNIIGELESPKCGGAATKEFKLNFATNGINGHQKYMQVTTTGTKFDLTSKVSGGAATTSSMKAKGTVTLASAGKLVCP